MPSVNFNKRNQFLIYTREKHKSVVKEFERLIAKDEDVKNQVSKSGSKSPRSIAIIMLIYNYVMEKNPEFKLPDAI